MSCAHCWSCLPPIRPTRHTCKTTASVEDDGSGASPKGRVDDEEVNALLAATAAEIAEDPMLLETMSGEEGKRHSHAQLHFVLTPMRPTRTSIYFGTSERAFVEQK